LIPSSTSRVSGVFSPAAMPVASCLRPAFVCVLQRSGFPSPKKQSRM
jgi:hypothetical protein